MFNRWQRPGGCWMIIVVPHFELRHRWRCQHRPRWRTDCNGVTFCGLVANWCIGSHFGPNSLGSCSLLAIWNFEFLDLNFKFDFGKIRNCTSWPEARLRFGFICQEFYFDRLKMVFSNSFQISVRGLTIWVLRIRKSPNLNLLFQNSIFSSTSKISILAEVEGGVQADVVKRLPELKNKLENISVASRDARENNKPPWITINFENRIFSRLGVTHRFSKQWFWDAFRKPFFVFWFHYFSKRFWKFWDQWFRFWFQKVFSKSWF